MKLGYQNEDLSNWKGKWIFLGAQQGLLNAFRRYRKTFVLPKKELQSAIIRMTAETRYLLWVNGQYVNRGPAKCYQWYQSYDTIDISAYLKPGKNSIAVLQHIVGKNTYSNVYYDSRAGILVDGEISFKDASSPLRIDTDTSWKAIIDPARSSKTPQLFIQLSFQESFDGRKDIPGWTLTDFNDAKWEHAAIVGPAGLFPWTNMEERGIPLFEERPELFTGVSCFYKGKNFPLWKDDNGLMRNLYAENRVKTISAGINVAVDQEGIRSINVPGTGKNNFLAMVLDLGKTSVGCPALEIKAAAGGEVIDFYYATRHPDSEMFLEVKNPDGKFQAGQDGLVDRYTCRKGTQSFRPFHFKGYRFLMLVFRNVSRNLEISDIYNRFVGYPVLQKGSFKCSDETFNKIWEMCERTLRCCMLDSYVDCPDREQAQWVGDAMVESYVNFFAFADTALLKRLIRQCAQHQTNDGLLWAIFPADYYGLIIIESNFSWLFALDNYYYFTKDASMPAEVFPVAEKCLAWFERFAGEKKLLGNPQGYWLHLDWSTIDKRGITASLNLYYVLALQAMQRICRAAGQDPAPYLNQETSVKKILINTFYDKTKGAWYENYNNGRLSQISQHANALACLAGLPNGKGAVNILKQSFLKKSTKKRPIASSYFAFFVLESLFRHKEDKRALELIKEGWGFMLDNGATTCWETFQSLTGGTVCHGWASHPLAFLSKYVLGIKPADKAWKAFRFEPTSDTRISSAKGKVPTPYGEITAEWQRDANGKLEYSLDYPKKIKLING